MQQLSGHTTPFAVLGHPIGHTLSPVMHNAALQAMEMDAIYLAFDVPPDDLMKVLPAMADMGFQGVNLTVPLKEVAFRGIKDLDDSARLVGAVNTVEFTAAGLRGHNTDGSGFLLAMQEAFGTGVAGMRVLVLGCGGAGRALALTCAREGATRIAVADVDSNRAAALEAEVASQLRPGASVAAQPADPAAWPEICAEVDLVIQATPVGMKKEDPPILPPAAFRDGQIAFDLVYMYPETSFTKAAATAGARTCNGLGMLLHQGAYALSIWTGRDVPVDVMRGALEDAVYG